MPLYFSLLAASFAIALFFSATRAALFDVAVKPSASQTEST